VSGYPATIAELLNGMACETARMSYPGSMSRGRKKIVTKGSKKLIEEYFVSTFPLRELWDRPTHIAKHYDAWHRKQIHALGRFLKRKGCLGNAQNNPVAVASKFINTFMHQLMKHEHFRPLWPQLHLPLDQRVFDAFRNLNGVAMCDIKNRIGGKTAYTISYDDYLFIQNALLDYIIELNNRRNAQFTVASRIELNYLWL
jgi:hypothetical protein